jgi:hypothetical protein
MATAAVPGFVACCTVCDAAAVATVIQGLFRGAGYVLLAHVSDMQFQALSQVDLVTALPQYEEGRIFAPAAELRWQRTARGTFALLLLTENESCVPATWTRLGAGWSALPAKQRIPLWGKRQDGEPYWFEARIPRALVYPIDKTTDPVYVAWIAYHDAQDTPRFIRFKEVQ